MSDVPGPQDPRQQPPGFAGRLLMVAARPPTPATWRRLRIILAGPLLLAVVGVATFGYWRHQQDTADQAPGVTAQKFCDDLKGMQYGEAYNLLSKSLHHDFSSDQFSDAFAKGLVPQLGALGTCMPHETGAYIVNQMAGTAHIQYDMGWATGVKGGDINLIREKDDSWMVDSIDVSLLGVGLGAIALSVAYCTALAKLDFGTAYAMLDTNAQRFLLGNLFSSHGNPDPQREFALSQIFHYIVDGEITSDGCRVSSFPSGNQKSSSSVVISFGRTNLPSFYVTVSMLADSHGNNWNIDSIERTDVSGNAQTGDPQGQDIGPLLIGERFCQSIDNGKDAVMAFLSNPLFTEPGLNAKQVIQQLYQGNRTFTGCYPQLPYQPPSGPTTPFSFALTLKVNSAPAPCTAMATVDHPQTDKNPSPNTWLIAGVQAPNMAGCSTT